MSNRGASIRSLQNVLGRVKEAATKSGEAISNGMAPTAHQSKNTDDGLEVPKADGSVTKDNDKKVKENVANVADAPTPKQAAARKKAEEDQSTGYQVMGPKPSFSGEDPENETESLKDTKDDPGTESPASTENSEIGKKYASYDSATLDQLLGIFKSASDSASTGLIVMMDARIKSAGFKPQAQNQRQPIQTPTAPQQSDAVAIKQAAVNQLNEIIKSAQHNADLVFNHLQGLSAGFQKGAEEPVPGEGAPPPAPEGGPAGGGVDPAMLESLGGAAASPPPGGGGGMPPEVGGMGGGGMPPEVEQILQALAAQGITPEQLQQMPPEQLIQLLQSVTGGGGDMGGGMPPEAGGGMPPEAGGMGGGGGMPPEAPPEAPPEEAPKEASAKTAKQVHNASVDRLQEIFNRSNQNRRNK